MVGRDWTVQTHLDGIPAPQRLGMYARTAWPTFFRQMGAITRSVHDVRGPQFGPVNGPGYAMWSEALARSPELATAADLVSSFAEMLTTLSGTDLPAWINQAAAANLPGISSFATGLNSDYDAVTAGLTTH